MVDVETRDKRVSGVSNAECGEDSRHVIPTF